MQRPTNLKEGDMFRVIRGYYGFELGDIISIKYDDGTAVPYFWNADKSKYYCRSFSDLEPYTKTIRDAQVGDVVVSRDGYEHLVLERGQNTVLISFGNEFKKSKDNYTFDQLEEYYTLKDTPEVVDTIAEAMKLLKEAGYKISKE